MITLTKKLKASQEDANAGKGRLNKICLGNGRISVRDRLLIQEVQDMKSNLPEGVQVKFDNPDALYEFQIIISPPEGFWLSGIFKFKVNVPEDYNIAPPEVKCETKLWHPNINEEGEICLSILRQNSIDGMGWAPTRGLKDLVWGLNSLFSDLLNFDDPLNIEAADHYQRDKDSFRKKVQEYIDKYCSKR